MNIHLYRQALLRNLAMGEVKYTKVFIPGGVCVLCTQFNNNISKKNI